MTLADKVTLARLGLMPVIVAAYLLLPAPWCFWVAGWTCALAEYTDLLDGRIARARGEVSDFGKLADPFCDVIYRIGVFLAFLLPAGAYALWGDAAFPIGSGGSGGSGGFGGSSGMSGMSGMSGALAHADVPGQLVIANRDGSLHAGLVPWLPVLLMTLREIVAGALRAMTATKGLVLAARTSGKVKAWVQGATIITCLGLPAIFSTQDVWVLHWAFWTTWLCAVLSVISISEYIWVNRGTLALLIERKPLP